MSDILEARAARPFSDSIKLPDDEAPRRNGKGKISTVNPLDVKTPESAADLPLANGLGHNHPPVDPRAKPVNEMFDKIAKHDATGEAQRITVGKKLIELRKVIEAEAPPYVARQGYTKSQHQAVHWWQWCKANIERSRPDIVTVMRIAGADDPEAALEQERQRVRDKSRAAWSTISAHDAPLRTRIREKYVDGKARKPEAIAKALEAPVEKVKHILDEMVSRPKTFTEDATRRGDGAYILTPIDRQIPLSRIKAELMPLVLEIIAEAKKGQVRIIPMMILKHAKKIEDAITEWEK